VNGGNQSNGNRAMADEPNPEKLQKLRKNAKNAKNCEQGTTAFLMKY
jgi:hypothetical protein